MEFIEEAGLIYDFVYGRIYKRQLKIKTYKICGNHNKTDGYHQIKIDGKNFRIHRILYEKYHNIKIPDNLVIDHINRIKTDNRIENLRIVSRNQNGQNINQRIDNTSGYKNICWFKYNKKWCVQIRVNGKKIHYGCFENIQDAIQKRDEAIVELNLEGHIFTT